MMNDMQKLADTLAAESHFIKGCVQTAIPIHVEQKARALCQDAIGDPNALDRNGNPRWKWYVERARAQLAKATGGTP
jgi:hypothetical protein